MGFCNTDIEYFQYEQFIGKLEEICNKHIVLFLSTNGEQRWKLESSLKMLEKNNAVVYRVCNTFENPTVQDIVQVLNSIKDAECIDMMLAIGGGSTIDMAKAICAFYRPYTILSQREIMQQIQNKRIELCNDRIGLIAVPTTAGTGSELTSWATVWDFDNSVKYSISHACLKPKEAWIVPQLTYDMPVLLQLSTGLDALCHATEAFWSKHTNPIAQEIAYRAIQLILDNMENAVIRQDIACKEQICYASVLSGMAFSQTKTTACHSISYPLTMLYHVPHGLAAAMTLPDVFESNQGHYPNSKLLFELFAEHDGLKKWLWKVCKGTIELSLKTWDVEERDIGSIAEKAFTLGRMDNNPVSLSQSDVEKMLRCHI